MYLALAIHNGDPGQLVHARQCFAHLTVQGKQRRHLLLCNCCPILIHTLGCSHATFRNPAFQLPQTVKGDCSTDLSKSPTVAVSVAQC